MKKSLIIKQHDLTDCGPACLASVISYYDGYVPIEMLRCNSYTDKSGTSAYNLIGCAKKYGLSAKGIRIKEIEKIDAKKIPFIAHLEKKNGLNHYVVVYEINNKSVLLMDPSKGKSKVSTKEFNSEFSGIIILLHPYKKM